MKTTSKKIIQKQIKNSIDVLNNEKVCNSYPFAVGVLKSCLKFICNEYKIDFSKMDHALTRHYKRT